MTVVILFSLASDATDGTPLGPGVGSHSSMNTAVQCWGASASRSMSLDAYFWKLKLFYCQEPICFNCFPSLYFLPSFLFPFLEPVPTLSTACWSLIDCSLLACFRYMLRHCILAMWHELHFIFPDFPADKTSVKAELVYAIQRQLWFQ